MKFLKLRQLILLTLLLVFTVTTVGVSVFTHFCKKDGVSRSFFVQKTHQCAPAVEVISCCSKKENNHCSSRITVEKGKCCSDSFENYKLSSEQENYSFSFKLSILRIQEFAVYSEFVPEILLAQTTSNLLEPPPKHKSGKEILLFNQVFRI
ncbi:MAG: hypothetical protein HYU67_00980 [Flavobacteriia bacterium]|nr:hypothetical protein [Flavobacteriia bacterium]